MADNLTLNSGSGGADLRTTEDASSKHHQHVILEFDDGTTSPVALVGGAGAVAGGVQRVTLASDDPAVTALQIIDDWDESNRAAVNLISGQAGIAAGAGAVGATVPRVTLASDDPAVALLGTIDTDTGGIATSASTIAGAVSGSEMQVDIVADGAGLATDAVLQDVRTSVQLLDDAVFVDDTATHTPASTKVVGIGAVATPTDGSVDANDIGMPAMSTDRRLHVDAQIVGQDANLTVDLGATDNAVLDSIDAAVNGTLTVGSHAVTNAGTFAVQEDGAALTALQLIDDIVAVLGTATYAEATTKGAIVAAVREDADASSSVDTDGEIAPLQVNAYGHLRTYDYLGTATLNSALSTLNTTTAAAGATAAGAIYNDDETWSDGVDQHHLVGGLYQSSPQTITDGRTGPIQVDANGNVKAALVAGTAAIGKLAANSGVDIGDVDVTSIAAGSNLIGDVGLSGARTSGGTTFFNSLDLDESEEQIKGSAGQLYWLHVMNLSASVIYLQVFNNTAAAVTVGTTTPDLVFPIPTQGDTNGAGFALSVPNGIEFDTGITVAATTTPTGSTSPGTNVCVINAGYA